MAKATLFLAAIALSGNAFGVTAQRAEEIRHLLLQDCGSCHGMTLKGGIGPSLLPADLAGKPDAYLSATILDGHPGTPMPPWRRFLTEDEVKWLVQLLRQGVNPK